MISAFIAASLVLAVTPGPGVMYIVTRSVVHGRRQGLVSVLGIAAGNLVNAVAAALGLAALFAVSALAFTVVKYAGAAYLIYLGIRLWRASSIVASESMAGAGAQAAGRVFRDGFVVAALNPKTTLFFAAFLPQFVRDTGNVGLQSLALGGLFVLIAAVTDSLYALAAGSVSRVLRGGSARLGRRAGATLYIGLGLLTAFTGTRGANR